MNDPLRALGVARTATLLDLGWTHHRIRLAVASGTLVRVRKGWVALPNSDPALVFAAQHGLLLSCVTQANRLNLWVAHSHVGHYAVRQAGSSRRPAHGILHWRAPIMPRPHDALEDPIENVLDSVAHCQPFEEAVAIWDSALNRGLVEHSKLAMLPFTGPAQKVLRACNRFSDSGLESYVRVRLRWLPVRIVWQAWVEGHRVDFLIGERLVFQIDGSTHVGEQRTKDNRHDALLNAKGYTVIRVGYFQVMNDWPGVQQVIMDAIARGSHLGRAA